MVEAHVEDALDKGACVAVGGHRSDSNGHFYEPTVLLDVDHTMACMREETFGPTLPIMKVADSDEAVRLANDVSYGLQASVWTDAASSADGRSARGADRRAPAGARGGAAGRLRRRGDASRHPELRLSLDAPDEGVTLNGSPTGVRLLLDNLLQNAALRGARFVVELPAG